MAIKVIKMRNEMEWIKVKMLVRSQINSTN
jgi:hypothetical protein